MSLLTTGAGVHRPPASVSTARQVTIHTPIGQVQINSGSIVRQTQLPGVSVTEGT